MGDIWCREWTGLAGASIRNRSYGRLMFTKKVPPQELQQSFSRFDTQLPSDAAFLVCLIC